MNPYVELEIQEDGFYITQLWASEPKLDPAYYVPGGMIPEKSYTTYYSPDIPINMRPKEGYDNYFVDASVMFKEGYTQSSFIFEKEPDGPYGSYIKQVSGFNIRNLEGGWRLAQKAMMIQEQLNAYPSLEVDLIHNRKGKVIYSQMMGRRAPVRQNRENLQTDLKRVLPAIPIDDTYPGNELGSEYREVRDKFYNVGGKGKGKGKGKSKGKKKNTKNKTKKHFLFNPENPKKSFDVYIDKNPRDTIHIKYTTVEDVKNTIDKLEKLYKNKIYKHKRIWQVAMIMKVRLNVLKNKKPKQYALANKYFTFLGKRTKLDEKDRYKLSFEDN